MTKEQMQAALDSSGAENAALKKKVAELETANGKLAAELKDAQQQISATAGSNAILEGDLKEAAAKIKELSANAKPEDGGKIEALYQALCRSCKDHCPHHLAEGACKNCTIHQICAAAGIQIGDPDAEPEA